MEKAMCSCPLHNQLAEDLQVSLAGEAVRVLILVKTQAILEVWLRSPRMS